MIRLDFHDKLWYTCKMSETNPTNKIKILADLWINYRDEEAFEEFVDYNDIGLPIAYAIHTEIVPPTPRSDLYIQETFDMLLASLGFVNKEGDVNDDGWDDLEDMLNNSSTYIVE
jgi:hypothetical protein